MHTYSPLSPSMNTCKYDWTHRVNNNLNCQTPDRISLNNLAVDSAALKHDSLSHAEHQLRWHLMCIIIIVRLHVYFRFSRFKWEPCASVYDTVKLSHAPFLFCLTPTHTSCKSSVLWGCLLWSLWLSSVEHLPHWFLHKTSLLYHSTKVIVIIIFSAISFIFIIKLDQNHHHALLSKGSPPSGILPHINTHTHIYKHIVADHHWLSSKIPRTIKGKGLSVSHVGDYGTEWQGTGDTKRPGWMHLRQAWQVWVTPGAGLHPSHMRISLASCHLSTTLLSLTLPETHTNTHPHTQEVKSQHTQQKVQAVFHCTDMNRYVCVS